jgi:hypothetical protein
MVAGRRNVYVWMLVVGVCLGAPARTFLVIVAWAGLTVLAHGVRTALWLRRGARPAPAAGGQELEIDPVTGALLSEK